VKKTASSRWFWLGLAVAALAAACAEGTTPDSGGDSEPGSGGSGGGRPTVFGGSPASTGGASSSGAGRASGAASGSAGTDEAGSGGQGGSAGPVEPDVCTADDGSGAPFGVTLKANSDAPMLFLQGDVAVTNGGDEAVALSELELRYYFESEYDPVGTESLEVRIYYADVSGGRLYRAITALVSGEVVRPAVGVATADAYLALRFDSGAGSLEPGEKMSAQFQLRPPAGHDDFYATQDQTNDYSFGACSQRAAPWPYVVLLHGGSVASGEPPPGVVDGGEGGQGGQGGQGGAAGQSGEGGQSGAAGAGGSDAGAGGSAGTGGSGGSL